MTIREMTANDWNEVATIYQQGIDTKKATFQQTVPDYEVWDESHIKECRYVAVEGDFVLGWVALTKISGRCVYRGVAEVSVYVGENARGKGVGKALLDAVIENSEKLGYWTLQSGIFAINKASISLHKACGFRMVGYREAIGCDEQGVWQDTVLMERRSKTIGR